METVFRKITFAPTTPYAGLKDRLLGAGVLRCSQAGFNITIGELAGLRDRIELWLADLEPGVQRWEVPVLLRPDWLPQGVWLDPADSQWCREEPGGFVLTPRLSMHMLNYLRWHAPAEGVWRLHGTCVRDETGTLPYYRQRVFSVVEYVWAARGPWAKERLDIAMKRLWMRVKAWDLPVDWIAAVEPGHALAGGDEPETQDLRGLPYPQELLLRLPDLAPVSLCRAELIPEQVCDAYGLEGEVASLACGLERWCLAVLTRHGMDTTGLQLG
jgi:hypothetical protein